jgi:hypothetical protein
MSRAYSPEKMIEEVQKAVGCFTLTALSEVVEIHYNTLLKITNHKIPVTETHLLRFHEASGLSVAYLRDLMGDDSEDIYRRPYGEPDGFYWDTEGNYANPPLRRARTHLREKRYRVSKTKPSTGENHGSP